MTEIEITPEMIEAGIDALELHEPNQPRSFLAVSVRDVLSSALATRKLDEAGYQIVKKDQ